MVGNPLFRYLFSPLLIVVLVLLLGVPISAAEDASPSSVSQTAALEADGFVSVSLDDRETASGKNLMIAAYAVIFGIFILYVFSILTREKRISADADALEKIIKNKL